MNIACFWRYSNILIKPNQDCTIIMIIINFIRFSFYFICMTLYFFLQFSSWRKGSEMESCRVNDKSRWYLDVAKKPPCRRRNGEKFVSACMQHCCVQTAVMAQPELQIFVLRHSHEPFVYSSVLFLLSSLFSFYSLSRFLFASNS